MRQINYCLPRRSINNNILIGGEYEKKLAMLFYSIGCVTGQLILFAQSIRQAGKHFREFEKLINDAKKAKKLGLK